MLNFIFEPLHEKLESQVSLAPFTTWHIGGNAEFFYQPKTIEQLGRVFQSLPDTLPLTVMGLGSNLLVRDGGVRGLVVHTKYLNKLVLVDDRIFAEAGVPCAKLARFSCQHDYTHGEFFSGIPGTVGGALAMNAGAFGGETWTHVDEVLTLDRKGNFHRRTPKEYEIGYRHVQANFLERELFIGAYFKFEKKIGIKEAALARIKGLLKKRSLTQPIGSFNCGSVFRNPEGHYAAQLIESLNLKGFRIGGAIISEKHANFIINSDKATSEDVEALIHHIQQKVLEAYKIHLVPEVRMIGQKRSD